MPDNPFATTQSFQQAFESGLAALLREGGLGPFILVCANASFDPRVEAATADGLARLYLELADEYVGALASGRPIQAVEEDLLVFLKLHAVGPDKLKPTETRRAGPWEVQFNHLRSFRPKRITTRVPEKLHAPFDEAGFHFNKGFMQKEAFWAGDLFGKPVSLYYNKYPFVDYHGLLVPEREKQHPQFLAQEHHGYLWEITGRLSQTLEGVGFGYNSLGAFASVNHLHFQMFLKPSGFPVMDAGWRHNGGGTPYPAACMAFDSADESWECLDALHGTETPYNLLYTPGKLHVFPRRKQGTYAQPGWTSGFTWHELAGGLIAFSREDYERLDEGEIERELAALLP